MKNYKVGDTTYRFPDEYSDQQVQDILTRQGIIGLQGGGGVPPASAKPPFPGMKNSSVGSATDAMNALARGVGRGVKGLPDALLSAMPNGDQLPPIPPSVKPWQPSTFGNYDPGTVPASQGAGPATSQLDPQAGLKSGLAQVKNDPAGAIGSMLPLALAGMGWRGTLAPKDPFSAPSAGLPDIGPVGRLLMSVKSPLLVKVYDMLRKLGPEPTPEQKMVMNAAPQPGAPPATPAPLTDLEVNQLRRSLGLQPSTPRFADNPTAAANPPRAPLASQPPPPQPAQINPRFPDNPTAAARPPKAPVRRTQLTATQSPGPSRFPDNPSAAKNPPRAPFRWNQSGGVESEAENEPNQSAPTSPPAAVKGKLGGLSNTDIGFGNQLIASAKAAIQRGSDTLDARAVVLGKLRDGGAINPAVHDYVIGVLKGTRSPLSER